VPLTAWHWRSTGELPSPLPHSPPPFPPLSSLTPSLPLPPHAAHKTQNSTIQCSTQPCSYTREIRQNTAVMCCTAQYCTVLYCTMSYCTVLYRTVLYCVLALPGLRWSNWRRWTPQHSQRPNAWRSGYNLYNALLMHVSTTQNSTVRKQTVQYGTIHTVLYSTVM